MAETRKKSTRKPPSGNAKGAARATPGKMEDVRCSSLSYRFKIALAKFDLDALRSAVHVDKTVKRQFHLVNTRDTEVADYHAHFEWRLLEKQEEITIDIQFVANPIKAITGDQEPFSDNVMRWVGKFFKHDDANAKVHSDFVFEAKGTVLSWFPLPLRTKVSKLDGEAILDGIAVALPSQPDSVSRFFLSHIKDSVFVGIESERRVRFADFWLDKELQVERTFANKLVEVKS